MMCLISDGSDEGMGDDAGHSFTTMLIRTYGGMLRQINGHLQHLWTRI
jgi:hypothetical protein